MNEQPSPKRARLLRWAAALSVAMVAVVAVGCDPAPPPKSVFDAACDGTLVASNPGTVASAAVDELSGIVASRRNPGVWWVHNDSGNPAAVYAVGDDGRDLGTVMVVGATNVDLEDIAVGPGPVAGTSYVYVGDIGDNAAARASVAVYRLPEPEAAGASGSVSAEKLTFTYPGGAHYDAEALLVDPATGEIFVVTKVLSGVARVFRAPANLPAGSTTVLSQVATVPQLLVTGADVTAAGDFVALRTYLSVQIYPRPAGGSIADALAQPPCAGATASEAQGEAIGFTPDGRGYVTASEGVHPALHEQHAP